MIQIIIYLMALGLDLFLLNTVNFVAADGTEIVFKVISVVVAFVWGIGLTACIGEERKWQYQRIFNIEQEKEDKKSYEKELKMYIEESKEYLTTEYKEYEENIFNGIKDSQLIAAYLEKGSYSKVLLEYNRAVRNLQTEINKCDRNISHHISRIKTASNNILGSGLFLPKYEEKS